jgi:trans-aconitate methyltransferase
MTLYERGNAAKQWIFTEVEKQLHGQPLRVLDLACGDGSKWPVFLEAHPQVQVVGIDTDADAIGRGMKSPHPRLTLRVADAQKQLNEPPFRVLTAFSAMEHVVDHAAFLKTAWDALAPGGIAYLNYDAGHFRSHDLKERLMVPVSQLLARVGVEGPYMKKVDDAAFRRLAEAQGFRVIGFRKHNIGSLKGFAKQASDEAIIAWYAFEEELGRHAAPEVLDALMLSSTLVLQKP